MRILQRQAQVLVAVYSRPTNCGTDQTIMPRSIEEGFDDFLTKLKPQRVESDASKSHRASIETRLRTDFGLNRFVRIGSFGNGTSISRHSDVDYLACLPTNQLTEVSTSSLVKVKNALAARFPFTGVAVNCPAVVVPFGSRRSEVTEVVPADYIREADGYKVYDIADCAGGWMKVSPDAHNAYVRSVDARLSGRLKPLIRFIKAWKFFRAVPISSFYLELRIAKYASEEKTIVYDIDVRAVLKFLMDGQLASLQDPMGVSGLIAACKSDATRADALSKLETAYIRADKARDATRSGKISEAFAWWRLLYNNEFPTYYRA